MHDDETLRPAVGAQRLAAQQIARHAHADAGVTVTLTPFAPLPRGDRERVGDAAERDATFLNLRLRAAWARALES